MLTHKEMVKKMLKNPGVKAAYDEQAEEFGLLDELLRARQSAGLTQAEVAQRMGTKAPKWLALVVLITAVGCAQPDQDRANKGQQVVGQAKEKPAPEAQEEEPEPAFDWTGRYPPHGCLSFLPLRSEIEQSDFVVFGNAENLRQAHQGQACKTDLQVLKVLRDHAFLKGPKKPSSILL